MAGDTENATVVRSLLADLVARGLDAAGGLLVVIDGAKALAAAVRRVFGDHALVQRCTLHKRRNVADHCPRVGGRSSTGGWPRRSTTTTPTGELGSAPGLVDSGCGHGRRLWLTGGQCEFELDGGEPAAALGPLRREQGVVGRGRSDVVGGQGGVVLDDLVHWHAGREGVEDPSDQTLILQPIVRDGAVGAWCDVSRLAGGLVAVDAGVAAAVVGFVTDTDSHGRGPVGLRAGCRLPWCSAIASVRCGQANAGSARMRSSAAMNTAACW